MILKFNPVLKTLVWGTENWVLSGVKGDETTVCEGPLAGKTINEVYGGEFPLLIKFIDAHRDLSIQVHPDDELARRRHGLNGKTEMWYIIGASAEAKLISGLKRELTPEQYVQLVAEDRIVDALCVHSVAPGDVFFMPAGRIHAICSGCYLAEIQQTSDLTYRIYDYGRTGLDGKPRQLHTELAKDAIDYKVYPEYRTPYNHCQNTGVCLVRDPHFTTSLYELTAPTAVSTEGIGRFIIVMCTEGEGLVSTAPAASCADGAPAADAVSIKTDEAILVLDHDAPICLSPSKAGEAVTFLTSY